MEDKQKEVALLLRARSSLLRVYDQKESPEILSIKENAKSAIEELRKEIPLKTRYEYFFDALTTVKGISSAKDIIKEKGKKTTPITKDLKPRCNPPETLKCMENALLLFTLKDGIKELYLNPEVEEFDLRNLPYRATATTLLSMSGNFFKTIPSALMTLRPEIRPTIVNMGTRLQEIRKKSKDIEFYFFNNRGLRGVYRLTAGGVYRRENLISFAKICGLLERDLLILILRQINFEGIVFWIGMRIVDLSLMTI
jgi:hypothetical protein